MEVEGLVGEEGGEVPEEEAAEEHEVVEDVVVVAAVELASRRLSNEYDPTPFGAYCLL